MKAGFLVVDKPAGITSHDVVSVLRALLGIKKVGHTGTLDPFATGVLPMALGSATRLIQFLDESRKTYVGRIRLGEATDTGDWTGSVTRSSGVPPLTLDGVQRVAQAFVGERMQTPPQYSAVKVKGKALYKYAREGKSVAAAPRSIRVYNLQATDVGLDWVDIHVECSRGTYVRVLAEELSESLGSVGHLVALRRVASGAFQLSNAVDFEQLSMIAAGCSDWTAVLRPPRGVARVPWCDPSIRRAAIGELLTAPDEALGHLPRWSLDPDDLSQLRLRGRTVGGPEGVGDGAHWLAFEGSRLLGVMVRRGDVHRVARMLAQS